MVSKIRFKNFKLFKNWQELELKPITILIGKNNSGKSAVLKLPTMIAGSLKGEFSDIIRLDNNGVKIGLEFKDLVYNRQIKLGDTLDLEVSSDSNESIFESLKVKIALPNDEIKDKQLLIEWIHFENDKPIILKKEEDVFRGFVKNDALFKNLVLKFDYIEALREQPIEEYYFQSLEIDKIGIKGENTYQILIKNKVLGNGNILKAVSSWYAENFENWSIEILESKAVSSSKMKFSFTLSNNSIEQINIINAGQGINQALPLITRSYMKDEEPVLIIIEEPESHLHPAAHGNLAQRFVDSIIYDENKRYLIETHSENFILRLQNLIADPDFPFTPDQLKIYYVDYDEDKLESSLKSIIINEDGEIEDWPDNIFNESIDEVYKLRRNQKKRSQNAGQN